MSDSWYYIRDGQTVGPISRARLVQELGNSPAWREEHVWGPGLVSWSEAGTVRELSSQLNQIQKAGRGPSDVVLYTGLAVLGTLSAVIVFWLTRS